MSLVCELCLLLGLPSYVPPFRFCILSGCLLLLLLLVLFLSSPYRTLSVRFQAEPSLPLGFDLDLERDRDRDIDVDLELCSYSLALRGERDSVIYAFDGRSLPRTSKSVEQRGGAGAPLCLLSSANETRLRERVRARVRDRDLEGNRKMPARCAVVSCSW